MSRKQIVKHSITLIFLTLLSRILGLIREMVRAAFLGTTAYSDAFSVAFLIPNLLRKLFAEGSVAVAFVPTFKGYLLENNANKIKQFLSATFTVISFLVTLTVVAGILLTPLIIDNFYASFSAAIQDETVFLTRIMFPFLALVSIAAFFQGILNARNIFAPSGFAPILLNISIITGTIVLAPFMANPARAMAISVVAGGVLQSLCQLPYVLKLGYRFTFVPLRKAFGNPGTRKVLRLVGPTIIGMAAYEINVLISSVIASTAGVGVISSLQFSNRLLELLLGIFAVSFGTVVLTELSENAKKENWDKFRHNMLFAINITALTTIPAMIFSLMSSTEIITLLFKMKSFTEESVILTATAFTFHISGLYFIAANRVIAPAFYAQEDTVSPTIAGIISVGVNLVFALLLVGPLKGGGVALAATIAAFVNLGFLLWLLTRKKQTSFKNVITGSTLFALKILFLSLISAVPLYFISDPLYGYFAPHSWRIISVGLPFALSALLYLSVLGIILAMTKDVYTTHLLTILKKRLSWKS